MSQDNRKEREGVERDREREEGGGGAEEKKSFWYLPPMSMFTAHFLCAYIRRTTQN